MDYASDLVSFMSYLKILDNNESMQKRYPETEWYYAETKNDKKAFLIHYLKILKSKQSDCISDIRRLKLCGDHANIVPIIGLCQKPVIYMLGIVTPYFPLTLDEIESKFHEEITHQKMCLLFLFYSQIAEGLNFLHENDVLHGYIASNSIIVDKETTTAKITDIEKFTILKKYFPDLNLTNHLPMAFISPEVTHENQNWSQSSDIYQYGITVFQSSVGFQLTPPNDVKLKRQFNKLSRKNRLPPFVIETWRMKFPKTILPVEMIEMIEKLLKVTVDESPINRYKAKELVDAWRLFFKQNELIKSQAYDITVFY